MAISDQVIKWANDLKELRETPTKLNMKPKTIIEFAGDHIQIYHQGKDYDLYASQDDIVSFYLKKEGEGLEQIGDEYYFPRDLNTDQIISDQSVIEDYAYAHENEWELLKE